MSFTDRPARRLFNLKDESILQQPMTKETFFLLLQRHDWTYMYSDDHTVWTKGCSEDNIIRRQYESAQLYKKMYQAFRDYHFPKDGVYNPDASAPKLEDF